MTDRPRTPPEFAALLERNPDLRDRILSQVPAPLSANLTHFPSVVARMTTYAIERNGKLSTTCLGPRRTER